ncbi:MAG: hypothetical protein OEY64_12490 [Nitrospinota bacterium]|nr:hypothetical protein [Nitrospinota bacterium]
MKEYLYTLASDYGYLWGDFFNAILNGFWAKFIATSLLIAAFWAGIWLRQFLVAFVFVFSSAAIAYLGGLIRYLAAF